MHHKLLALSVSFKNHLRKIAQDERFRDLREEILGDEEENSLFEDPLDPETDGEDIELESSEDMDLQKPIKVLREERRHVRAQIASLENKGQPVPDRLYEKEEELTSLIQLKQEYENYGWGTENYEESTELSDVELDDFDDLFEEEN